MAATGSVQIVGSAEKFAPLVLQSKTFIRDRDPWQEFMRH
jgi:hypothetical protein